MPKHIWIFVEIEVVIIFFQFQLPKENHVEKSFSFLLWKLWLTLRNKKIPKETHVENSFSFLLIPKPTCFRKCLTTFFTGICLWHTVQGYGFSLSKCLKIHMWISHFHFSCEKCGKQTLHNKRIPKETQVQKSFSFLLGKNVVNTLQHENT